MGQAAHGLEVDELGKMNQVWNLSNSTDSST